MNKRIVSLLAILFMISIVFFIPACQDDEKTNEQIDREQEEIEKVINTDGIEKATHNYTTIDENGVKRVILCGCDDPDSHKKPE